MSMSDSYDDRTLLETGLRRAYRAALNSPDPSTQNGSYLQTLRGKNISDCNRFPTRVEVTPERLVRPLKYSYIEHAERNAIYAAAVLGSQTAGATLYCPWFACHDCARGIIQAGITRVVGHKWMFDSTPDHWKESIAIAFEMFEEAGTYTVLFDGSVDAEPILFNEKAWDPRTGRTIG